MAANSRRSQRAIDHRYFINALREATGKDPLYELGKPRTVEEQEIHRFHVEPYRPAPSSRGPRPHSA